MPWSRSLPDPESRERRAWVWAAALQASAVVVELLVAPRANSGTLWSDAAHNGNDILLICLSAWPSWATVITRRKFEPTRKSRWRHRAEIVNIFTLMATGAAIMYTGYLGLTGRPQIVHFDQAWPILALSCAVNILVYAVIRPFRQHGHVQVLGWHQLWDVGTSLLATIILWAGSRVSDPSLDKVAMIIIGTAMFLHWPLHALLARNGHRH